MDPDMRQQLAHLEQLFRLQQLRSMLEGRLRALNRVSEEVQAQQRLLGEEEDAARNLTNGNGGGDGEQGIVFQVSMGENGVPTMQPMFRATRNNQGGVSPMSSESWEEAVVMRVIQMSLEAAQNNRESAPPKIADEDLDAIREAVVTKKMLDKVPDVCTICHEDIKVGMRRAVLPCTHLFCRGCIDEWLKQSRTCPICRMEMVGVEKLYKEHNTLQDEPTAVEATWRKEAPKRPNRLEQAMAHAQTTTRSDSDDSPGDRPLRPARPAPRPVVLRASNPRPVTYTPESDRSSDSDGDTARRGNQQRTGPLGATTRLGMSRDRLALSRSQHDEEHDAGATPQRGNQQASVVDRTPPRAMVPRMLNEQEVSDAYGMSPEIQTGTPVGGARGLLRRRSSNSVSSTPSRSNNNNNDAPSASATPRRSPANPPAVTPSSRRNAPNSSSETSPTVNRPSRRSASSTGSSWYRRRPQ